MIIEDFETCSLDMSGLTPESVRKDLTVIAAIEVTKDFVSGENVGVVVQV